MRAWLFQDSRQKKRLGEAKCPWSVGYLDPSGRRRSKRVGSKSNADKFRRKIEGQLAAGTFDLARHTTWDKFRLEFEQRVLVLKSVNTQNSYKKAMDAFKRHCKPQKMNAIRTSTIDDFISHRKNDPGKKPGSSISNATINRDLRHLRACLTVAHDWKYVLAIPKFRFLRELNEIGPVISAKELEAIYKACAKATMPKGPDCNPKDWWQALIVFAVTTGWRIEEMLQLRIADIDFGSGQVMTRAKSNKARRDEFDFLPSETLVHVQRIKSSSPLLFDWPHNQSTLYKQFHRIQKCAGINIVCSKADEHECSDSCHRYGFHALRRTFATNNAGLPAPILQRKMRHRSFRTTLGYLQLAEKLKNAVGLVHVPEFLQSDE